MIGLSQSHTSRLELSSPNPRDATIRRVADALHVPFEELKPPPPPKKPWPAKGLRWLRIVMPLTVKLRSLHYLATPAAQQAIADAGQKVTDFLDLNAVGDWGEVCPTDAARNDQALLDGGRVVSQYTTHLDANSLLSPMPSTLSSANVTRRESSCPRNTRHNPHFSRWWGRSVANHYHPTEGLLLFVPTAGLLLSCWRGCRKGR